MEIIYRADDGTEFRDEDECLEYERFHSEKAKKLLSEIHAFDRVGNEMKVGDGPNDYDLENMIARAGYVSFDSEEAFEFFDEQQDYYGYAKIGEWNRYTMGDVYIYKLNGDCWESANEMIGHYQELIDKFAEGR